VDLCSSSSGELQLKVPPDRCRGGDTLWQQSSSFDPWAKEVTGRCLLWMLGLPEGPGRPGWSEIVWPTTGWSMAATGSTDPS